jgi:hypothetical protein
MILDSRVYIHIHSILKILGGIFFLIIFNLTGIFFFYYGYKLIMILKDIYKFIQNKEILILILKVFIITMLGTISLFLKSVFTIIFSGYSISRIDIHLFQENDTFIFSIFYYLFTEILPFLGLFFLF